MTDAPLRFIALTPAPPLTLGPPWRGPDGTDRVPGNNTLLDVDRARGDTHSWLSKAEQLRAGFIVDCVEADRGKCSGQSPVPMKPSHLFNEV